MHIDRWDLFSRRAVIIQDVSEATVNLLVWGWAKNVHIEYVRISQLSRTV